MAQTSEGAKKAAKTNLAKYGNDFYSKIGTMGGKTKTDKPKGFATLTYEQLSKVSAKGGRRSRRS